MIRSMTGFGRASFQVDALVFDVEVRAVNHRYLDVRARLPRLLSALESKVRARVQARFDRGKVDLTVTAPAAGRPPAVGVDTAAARGYLDAAAVLRSEGVPGELEIGTILTLPGVARVEEPEVAPDVLNDALLAGVDEAIGALDTMRVAEGAALERDLLARVAVVAAASKRIEGRSGEVQRMVRERLQRRAEQLAQETGLRDEARLHQELVIAADRLDITEELVRLQSHVDQFRTILAGAQPGNPVGRRLDFLLQEFGREANTVGSKASDAPVAHEIVDLKAEIERLREQVQNVE